MSKLLKKPQVSVDAEDFEEFINDGLKPIGFSDDTDELFFAVKRKFFVGLAELVQHEGPSFDVEIYFNSVIDDLNDTFIEILGSLRSYHENRS